MASHDTSSSKPNTPRPAPIERNHTRSPFKNKLILYAVLIGGAFLLGYLPQFMKAKQLQTEVQTLRWQNQLGIARDHIGLAFLEVSNNNFGVASQHASTFFDSLRNMAGAAEQAGKREELQAIAAQRDAVTAGLAKADPATRTQVQEIMARMHQISSTPAPVR